MPNENEILAEGLAVLQRALPAKWQVQQQPSPDQPDQGHDAVLITVGHQNNSARALVEIRRAFGPIDVPAVIRQARLINQVAGNTPIVVMAPLLSQRSRDLLIEADINYVDFVGNIRFSTDYPPIYIYREAKTSGPPSPQYTPSLKGKSAGRVVRAMADMRPPYNVTELALFAKVSPGYVSRLLEFLESEEIVERSSRRSIVSVDWAELLRQRAERYDVFKTNEIRRFVCPNGAAYALETAQDLKLLGLGLSGSFAAESLVSAAVPALLVLYSTGAVEPLIQRANLLDSDVGSNVVIAKPYDMVVFDRPLQRLDLGTVSLLNPSQIAIDCLSGNGRMPQEGDSLLDWMSLNEDAWRQPVPKIL